MSNPTNCLNTPCTKRYFAHSKKNTPLVFLQQYLINIFEAGIRDGLPSTQLLDMLKLSDPMMGSILLNHDLRVTYALQRMKGERGFNSREDILFEVLLTGITRMS